MKKVVQLILVLFLIFIAFIFYKTYFSNKEELDVTSNENKNELSDNNELPVATFDAPIKESEVNNIDINTIDFGLLLTKLENFFNNVRRVFLLLKLFILTTFFNNINEAGIKVSVSK